MTQTLYLKKSGLPWSARFHKNMKPSSLVFLDMFLLRSLGFQYISMFTGGFGGKAATLVGVSHYSCFSSGVLDTVLSPGICHQ